MWGDWLLLDVLLRAVVSVLLPPCLDTSVPAVSHIRRPFIQNSNEANKTTGWNSENNVTACMGRAALIYMTMLRCSLAWQNDCCYENELAEQEWPMLTTPLGVVH
jgi:hypothetical protein